MSKTNDNNQLVGVANAKPQAAPPTNEVFIRVGTTLYKVVDQPTINGGKRLRIYTLPFIVKVLTFAP